MQNNSCLLHTQCGAVRFDLTPGFCSICSSKYGLDLRLLKPSGDEQPCCSICLDEGLDLYYFHGVCTHPLCLGCIRVLFNRGPPWPKDFLPMALEVATNMAMAGNTDAFCERSMSKIVADMMLRFRLANRTIFGDFLSVACPCCRRQFVSLQPRKEPMPTRRNTIWVELVD
jgi:hypothetical protein